MLFVHLMGRFLKKNHLVFHFIYNLFAQTNPFFKRCSVIGLFFVCNLLFIFIVQQILANNVKTGELVEFIIMNSIIIEFDFFKIQRKISLSNFTLVSTQRESNRIGRVADGHVGED